MPTVQQISTTLEQLAPARLAEGWDNVGLLVGDPLRNVERVMTCLTVTRATAREAIDGGAQLIVSHHPCPFHSLKRITTATPIGRILLDLIGGGVAVYSPHTAYDSAGDGVNQQIAQGLGLRGIAPLKPSPDGVDVGRTGRLETPVSLGDFVEQVKQFFGVELAAMVGDPEQSVRTVAIACGAAGELIAEAKANHCDAMILGETAMHNCLDAAADRLALVMPGHFASERFALERLAERLAELHGDIDVWASTVERDPIQWR